MRQGQRWRLWASGHGAHGQQPPEATSETQSDSPSEPSGDLSPRTPPPPYRPPPSNSGSDFRPPTLQGNTFLLL